MKIFNFLLIFLMVFLSACNPEAEAPKAKIKTPAQKVKRNKAKAKKDSAIAQEIRRIPPGKKATRFSIHRMNEVSGQGKLQATPYKLGQKNLKIVGVAVDDVAQSPAHSVFINLNGELIPTNYGGNSSGFAKAAKNNKYKNAGFQITIPNNRFKKGENKIKVLILGKGKKYKFAPPRTYKVIK